MHTFGFNWWNFKQRFYQMFVLNFSWVQTLILLLFMISFCVKRNFKALNKEKIFIFITLAIVYLGFVVFNLFYITHNHPRYVVACVFFLLFFSYYGLLSIVRDKRIRIAILSGLIILSSMQMFRTVDPLSKAAFGTFNFGEHQMLNMNLADGLIYNAEYVVIDKLFNKLNKEIGINDNSKIILSETQWGIHFNGSVWLANIFIDRENLKRTFKTENAFQPEVYLVWDIGQNNVPDQAYYIVTWIADEKNELKHLQNYYQIVEPKVIDHEGYYFKVYLVNRLIH